MSAYKYPGSLYETIGVVLAQDISKKNKKRTSQNISLPFLIQGTERKKGIKKGSGYSKKKGKISGGNK